MYLFDFIFTAIIAYASNILNIKGVHSAWTMMDGRPKLVRADTLLYSNPFVRVDKTFSKHGIFYTIHIFVDEQDINILE